MGSLFEELEARESAARERTDCGRSCSFPRVDVTPAPEGLYAALKVRGIAETGAQVDRRSRPWPPLNRAAFPCLP